MVSSLSLSAVSLLSLYAVLSTYTSSEELYYPDYLSLSIFFILFLYLSMVSYLSLAPGGLLVNSTPVVLVKSSTFSGFLGFIIPSGGT